MHGDLAPQTATTTVSTVSAAYQCDLGRRMRRLILSLGVVAIFLLLSALLFDISNCVFGGLFTADTYYLPLREVVPEESVREMENTIIDVHTRVMCRRSIVLGAVHIVALVALLSALRTRNNGLSTIPKDHQDVMPANTT